MTERLVAHGCVTCGDEAVPMRVLEVDRLRGLALCSAAEGGRSSVEIALVEPVAAGEMLLVHAGTALGRADAEQVETALAGDAKQQTATACAGDAEQVESTLTAAGERRSRA
jgi:hydrogenase maturation factor